MSRIGIEKSDGPWSMVVLVSEVVENMECHKNNKEEDLIGEASTWIQRVTFNSKHTII